MTASNATPEPRFLTVGQLLDAHDVLVVAKQCAPGLPRPELLESACEQARATFDGEFVHLSLPAMAAAYAFHICQNHPFVDGNKRTALSASVAFLYVNEISFEPDDEELYNAIIAVAEGRWTKADLTAWFESQCSA
jgi:death-on-curing protein